MKSFFGKLVSVSAFLISSITAYAQPTFEQLSLLPKLVIQASPAGVSIWNQLLEGKKTSFGIELTNITPAQKICLEDNLVGEGFNALRTNDVTVWAARNLQSVAPAVEILQAGGARIAGAIQREAVNPKFDVGAFIEKSATESEAQALVTMMTESKFASLRQLLGLQGMADSGRNLAGVALLIRVEANAGQACDVKRK
jgi:hypothetical protein